MAIGKAPLSVDEIVKRQREEKEAASKVRPRSSGARWTADWRAERRGFGNGGEGTDTGAMGKSGRGNLGSGAVQGWMERLPFLQDHAADGPVQG